MTVATTSGVGGTRELPKITKQLLTEDLVVDKDILQQKRSFPNLHCDKLLKGPVRKSR